MVGWASELGVVVLTSGYVLWGIAVEREVVEDGSLGAAGNAWVFSLHADVEASAVIGLDVTGVVQDVTIGVDLGGVGAGETVIEDLDSDAASGSDTGVFPLAGAGELIEDEAGGASPEDGKTVGALVVLVAVGGVFVLEVTVQAGAFNTRWLGCLKSGAFGASYDEWVVALLNTGSN